MIMRIFCRQRSTIPLIVQFYALCLIFLITLRFLSSTFNIQQQKQPKDDVFSSSSSSYIIPTKSSFVRTSRKYYLSNNTDKNTNQLLTTRVTKASSSMINNNNNKTNNNNNNQNNDLTEIQIVKVNNNDINAANKTTTTTTGTIMVPHQTALVTKQKNKKMRFILHVGPPKTASSTIQHTLEQLQSILHKEDNFYYAGKIIGSNVQDFPILNAWNNPKCYNQLDHNMFENNDENNELLSLQQQQQQKYYFLLPQCWKDMIQLLTDLYNNQTNVIVSEENLSLKQVALQPAIPWKLLQATLLPLFHVEIVIGYRPWYEWILSSKNQLERPSKGQPKRKLWPQNGGLRTQPIYPYINAILHNKQPPPFVYTTQTIDMYQQYFDTIHVFELQNHQVMETFLCDICNATNTCMEYKNKDNNNNKQEPRESKTTHDNNNSTISTTTSFSLFKKNPSVDFLQYDILSVAAMEQGLLNNVTELQRANVAQQAQTFHQQHEYNNNNNTIFIAWNLTCPTTHQLQQILQDSLKKDQRVFSSNNVKHYNNLQLERNVQLETTFWKHANEDYIFCTVNSTATLQDEKWRNFFTTLGKVKKKRQD